MRDSIGKIIARHSHRKSLFRPEMLDINRDSDAKRFGELLQEEGTEVFDEIEAQLNELMRLRSPSKKLTAPESAELARAYIGGRELHSYGIWAYYPWNGQLVHLLGEAEFIEVRTNRNQHKITKQEQDALSKKSIGIIGMSVGSSIAVTMAMERICGEIRIADYDTLDLSNFNRIRTGVSNIGLSKVVNVAREIATIDPYLKVLPYPEGLTADNMEDFLIGSHKLDVLIDECDDIRMKLECRYRAKAAGIPVVMETSDRGMLDVEQYQVEPGREVFHGLLQKQYTFEELGNLSPAERFELTMRVVEHSKLSDGAKKSISEIGKSISTWPQLASAIMLGAGTCTDVCRKILLGQFRKSGRYYVDLNEIVQ